MRQFTFPRMRTALVALCSMSLLAVVLVYTQRVSAIDQDILKLNRIVQTNKVNTAATMIFKEGRDMIEAQKLLNYGFEHFATMPESAAVFDAAMTSNSALFGCALRAMSRCCVACT